MITARDRLNWQFFCRLILFIAGIVLSVVSTDKIANANSPIQNLKDKQVQLRSTGYFGPTVYFETSMSPNIEEFEWIAFSCNGYERQMQAKNVIVSGKAMAIILYEDIPCSGNVSKVSYKSGYRQAKKKVFKKSGEMSSRGRRKAEAASGRIHEKKCEIITIHNGNNAKGSHKHESLIEKKICSVFGKECKMAIAIARAESNLDPSAIGDKHLKKYSYGIFQISALFHNHAKEDLLNPDKNIMIAKQIRDDFGWDRWTTYRNGMYKAYLR